MGILLLLALIGGGAAWLWGRLEMGKREEAREEETRAGFKRRIAEDERNTGAREALGDSLRRAGRLPEARDVYDEALTVGGEQGTIDRTRYKREQVARDIAERAASNGPFWRRRPVSAREFYFCPVCGIPNPPRATHCESCQARLPAESFWEALTDREILRSAVEGVGMIAVLGIVFRVFAAMPLEIKGVLIISATAVLSWRVLQAIEGRKG